MDEKKLKEIRVKVEKHEKDLNKLARKLDLVPKMLGVCEKHSTRFTAYGLRHAGTKGPNALRYGIAGIINSTTHRSCWKSVGLNGVIDVDREKVSSLVISRSCAQLWVSYNLELVFHCWWHRYTNRDPKCSRGKPHIDIFIPGEWLYIVLEDYEIQDSKKKPKTNNDIAKKLGEAASRFGFEGAGFLGTSHQWKRAYERYMNREDGWRTVSDVAEHMGVDFKVCSRMLRRIAEQRRVSDEQLVA